MRPTLKKWWFPIFYRCAVGDMNTHRRGTAIVILEEYNSTNLIIA